MRYNNKLLLLLLFVSTGLSLNTASAQGIEEDQDLGGGWSYSDVYGAYYELGSNWNYSDWFGTFYTVDGNWFWRPGFGWTYLVNNATVSNWWIYVYELSDWCWTNDEAYPAIRSTTADEWVYFQEDVLGFYNPSTQQYASAGVNSVDFVITNLGVDQSTWQEIISTIRGTFAQVGYTDFYQLESSANDLILRFNFGSAQAADLYRQAMQPVVGDFGSFRYSLR